MCGGGMNGPSKKGGGGIMSPARRERDQTVCGRTGAGRQPIIDMILIIIIGFNIIIIGHDDHEAVLERLDSKHHIMHQKR
jgi:hypothetical protein